MVGNKMRWAAALDMRKVRWMTVGFPPIRFSLAPPSFLDTYAPLLRSRMRHDLSDGCTLLHQDLYQSFPDASTPGRM
jgi:hypothetical protein